MICPIPETVRIERGSVVKLSILCWTWELVEVKGGIYTAALVVNPAEKKKCKRHSPSPTRKLVYGIQL